MKILLADSDYYRGETLPWYYGCAYREVHRRASVWYPIPLHLFVRFAVWLHDKWSDFRGNAPEYIAYSQIQQEVERERARGYADGRVAGWKAGRAAAYAEMNKRFDALVAGKKPSGD